jgi:hypothetical protein
MSFNKRQAAINFIKDKSNLIMEVQKPSKNHARIQMRERDGKPFLLFEYNKDFGFDIFYGTEKHDVDAVLREFSDRFNIPQIDSASIQSLS